MLFRGLLSLYNPAIVGTIMVRLEDTGYSGLRLFHWFWTTKTYSLRRPLSDAQRSAAILLGLCMIAQISVGVALLVEWARHGTAGSLPFGVALLVSYPVIWTHIAVVLALAARLAWAITHPKKAARGVVCTMLEVQVKQLRSRHHFKVVAVVGSLGKTSTKTAIADLLGQSLRVRYQAGNYNDRVTVPLIFFGLSEPSLYNPLSWFKVFGATQSEIALPYPYDVVVVELGSDGPGQLRDFAYLRPDITVVTAVAPEHMENFLTVDAVADEELTVFDYSKRVLVNGDDIAAKYLVGRTFSDYSLASERAEYFGNTIPSGLSGQKIHVSLPKGTVSGDVSYVGLQGAKFAVAAVAVADMLDTKPKQIEKALPELKAFSGRMQILQGTKNSTLIDDTYNSAPASAEAALDVLYATKAKQRIAVLGSINEMGDYAREAHQEVGAYCNAKKLDMVVTVGSDAKKWLAPAALEQGCTVKTFKSPYDAGDYVLKSLKDGAIILFKGSQNGVYTEEALKPMLIDPKDAEKLVRQSHWWLKTKAKQFPR